MSIFVHGAAATPTLLLEAMCRRTDLTGIRLYHLHTEGPSAFLEPGCRERFTSISFFTGRPLRQAVEAGVADFIPVFLSDIPSLFRDASIRLDAALLQVSPPDRHGFCSLGTSVDAARAAADCAPVLIAEVNQQMPRTHGHSMVAKSSLTACIRTDRPLYEQDSTPETSVEAAIGEQVAALIENGSTLQTGGQMDFMRGAAMSRGGLPIIALPSTAGGGQFSRIAAELAPGSGVVTTRGHVHWVVTEHGAVNLHGLSLRQRGERLISIAHPDFRSELRNAFCAIRHYTSE